MMLRLLNLGGHLANTGATFQGQVISSFFFPFSFSFFFFKAKELCVRVEGGAVRVHVEEREK